MGIHISPYKNLCEDAHLLFPNSKECWHVTRRFLVRTILKHTTGKYKTLPGFGLTINKQELLAFGPKFAGPLSGLYNSGQVLARI